MTPPVKIADIANCGARAAAILATLHRRCFETAWSQAEFARLLARDGAYAFIAARAEREIGLLFAQRVLDEAEIYALGVLPRWRRQGIGTRLINVASGALARDGAKNVFLEVAETDSSALGCYRKNGFDVAGRRPGYYPGSGRARTAIVMRHRLVPHCTMARHRT